MFSIWNTITTTATTNKPMSERTYVICILRRLKWLFDYSLFVTFYSCCCCCCYYCASLNQPPYLLGEDIFIIPICSCFLRGIARATTRKWWIHCSFALFTSYSKPFYLLYWWTIAQEKICLWLRAHFNSYLFTCTLFDAFNTNVIAVLSVTILISIDVMFSFLCHPLSPHPKHRKRTSVFYYRCS